MSVARVIPLTERALLNSTVLDWIYPPNCQKLKIQSVGNSALETLIESRHNPYSNQMNNSNWHWGTKPVKSVGRVLYTAVVTATVSPVGAMVFGVVTVKCLAHYGFAVYQGDKATSAAEWVKTKEYAKAYFTDLTCCIVGVTISGTMILMGAYTLHILRIGSFLGVCTESLGYSILYGLTGAGCVAGCAYLLGGFEPSYIIPQLVAWEGERVGMYLALTLRNDLGLVNENGGVLSFSAKDKLEYDKEVNYRGTSIQFKGPVIQCLITLVFNAELELLEKVRDANHYLLNKGKQPIPYTYPFDGNAVAKILQDRFKSTQTASELALVGQEDAEVQRLVHDLRMLAYKVKTLRNIDYSSKKLTLEDSIWMMFVKAMAKQSPTNVTIPQLPSYVDSNYYRVFFNMSQAAPSAADSTVNLQTLDLPALDPDYSQPENHTAYAQFKHRVQVAKWGLENGQPKSAKWLLGLEENCSYVQYKGAIRALSLAIHPDKNGNTDESKKFFQLLAPIQELLDKEFKR